jgi:hypothetical protein
MVLKDTGVEIQSPKRPYGGKILRTNNRNTASRSIRYQLNQMNEEKTFPSLPKELVNSLPNHP